MKNETIDLMAEFFDEVSVWEMEICQANADVTKEANEKLKRDGSEHVYVFDITYSIVQDIIYFILYLSARGKKILGFSKSEIAFIMELVNILRHYAPKHDLLEIVRDHQMKKYSNGTVEEWLELMYSLYLDVQNKSGLNDYSPFSFTYFLVFEREYSKLLGEDEIPKFMEDFLTVLEELGSDYYDCDKSHSTKFRQRLDDAIDSFALDYGIAAP